jgi:hypothetical protein
MADELTFDELKDRIGDDFSAIVISPDGQFLWTEELIAMPIIPPYALGSGREAALGAMYAGCDATNAVEIACKLDVYSGLPVDSMACATTAGAEKEVCQGGTPPVASVALPPALQAQSNFSPKTEEYLGACRGCTSPLTSMRDYCTRCGTVQNLKPLNDAFADRVQEPESPTKIAPKTKGFGHIVPPRKDVAINNAPRVHITRAELSLLEMFSYDDTYCHWRCVGCGYHFYCEPGEAPVCPISHVSGSPCEKTKKEQ